MPLLNEADCLPGTIQRLADLKVDELVFVDGGSSDGSGDLLRQAGVSFFISEPGRAKQMNLGAAKIQSDILLFLHIDTDINSSDLSAVKEAMQDKNTVAGRFNVRLSGNRLAFRVIEFFINWRSRLSKISSGDQAMFVRREVFERLGGFPDQALMEDIGLSKRLKKQGKITCLRRKVVTSSRRWEQHGIMRTVLLMWKLRFLYWLGIPADRLAAQYIGTGKLKAPTVMIMCKAPVAGAVKTRLMVKYSAEQAAQIHMAMAETVIRRAMRLFEDVRIAADDPGHGFFAQFGIPVVEQGQGSLGDRMARLLSGAAENGSVLFLGTDSPHMSDARLLEAADALDGSDVVIGPVEDGGYDLIALQRDWPVYEGVEWSTGEVLAQTLANCRKLRLKRWLLDISFDIDTPDDLARAEASGWRWQDIANQ